MTELECHLKVADWQEAIRGLFERVALALVVHLPSPFRHIVAGDRSEAVMMTMLI